VGDKAMHTYRLFAILLAILWIVPTFAKAEAPSIEVWKSAICQCCIKWVEHLEANGLAVKVNDVSPSILDKIKREAGIGEKYAACHTAKIEGYAIEGHVPAADIKAAGGREARRGRPDGTWHAGRLARHGAGRCDRALRRAASQEGRRGGSLRPPLSEP
jgi:hypothetical protein